MPKTEKYVPKHRAAAPSASLARTPRQVLRTTLLLSGVAAAATGLSVSGGVISTPATAPAAGEAPRASAPSPSAGEQRKRSVATVSRSGRRDAPDPAKASVRMPQEAPSVSRQEDLSHADPRDVARALLPEFGFDASQFSCLDALYVSESNWRVDADNPTSSAYGIPQALTELHDLPADYMTSAEAQIRWGLGYIRDTYGTPCSAWGFKQGNGWY